MSAVTDRSIDTDAFSARLRLRALDSERRQIRITKLTGSLQEQDLKEPVNCDGLGRIRHFRTGTSPGWPLNPLPIIPAARALGTLATEEIRAQVFQNAVCNWRCWYCFVDFELLSGSESRSRLVSCEQLVDLYLAQSERPTVIDLSGGQPDLVPEWPLWMLDALESRRLDNVYLWSDDNLSNDFFFGYLTSAERERLGSFGRYGKVCCLKGFNANSFAFNTRASPELFDRQFALLRRYLEETEIDLYCYVTLTTPHVADIEHEVANFVDRLQGLHPNFPLRTVPLEVAVFSPVAARLSRGGDDASLYRKALELQQDAVVCWDQEMRRRFSDRERDGEIVDVGIRG